jgi:cytochrome c5
MIRNNIVTLPIAAAAALLLTGCPGDPEPAAGFEMPRFADPVLAEGRSVWMGTCRACHLLGVAGAPAVTDYDNWQPRIAKGLRTLYKSPIHGIRGDDGKYRMPPRGGNDRLSDEQIERAVQYMVASVEYLQEQRTGTPAAPARQRSAM